MSEDERKQVADEPAEDLELDDAQADQVRGGDGAVLTNIQQTKDATTKSIIGNIRP
jgi:hypothetical protein